jgi:hypothetical protein
LRIELRRDMQAPAAPLETATRSAAAAAVLVLPSVLPAV